MKAEGNKRKVPEKPDLIDVADLVEEGGGDALRTAKTFYFPDATYSSNGKKLYGFFGQSMTITIYSDASGTRCTGIYVGKFKQLGGKKSRSRSPHPVFNFDLLNKNRGVLRTLKTPGIAFKCKGRPLTYRWPVPPEEFELITGVKARRPSQIRSSRC